jgi:hypothetical protein
MERSRRHLNREDSTARLGPIQSAENQTHSGTLRAVAAWKLTPVTSSRRRLEEPARPLAAFVSEFINVGQQVVGAVIPTWQHFANRPNWNDCRRPTATNLLMLSMPQSDGRKLAPDAVVCAGGGWNWSGKLRPHFWVNYH